MTQNDRKKWDVRYLDSPGSTEPSAVLERFWRLAPCGRALDIACGNGRNSLFLAQKGFTVDAVDVSTVATGRLAGKDPRITVICRDLDTWQIPVGRYDLIVKVRFLDRRLFPMIRAGLKPQGVLIVESFAGGQREAYCLKPNELLRAFHAFQIVFYEEKRADHTEKFDQIVSMVAIKPASADLP